MKLGSLLESRECKHHNHWFTSYQPMSNHDPPTCDNGSTRSNARSPTSSATILVLDLNQQLHPAAFGDGSLLVAYRRCLFSAHVLPRLHRLHLALTHHSQPSDASETRGLLPRATLYLPRLVGSLPQWASLLSLAGPLSASPGIPGLNELITGLNPTWRPA